MASRQVRGDLRRQLAASPGGLWVTGSGNSMLPTIKHGDRVCVRTCVKPRPGDVVLFETKDGADYVLHRLVFRVPMTSLFVHIGDGAVVAGVSEESRIVGRADVPRQRLSLATYARATRRLAKTFVGRVAR